MRLKSILNKEFLKNILLAFSFPVLLYLSHHYFNFLIWITFVPVVILIYGNNVKSFIFYLLVLVFGTAFLKIYFIQYFDLKLFFITFAYLSFAYFSAILVCFFLFKKIKYPYAVFILPGVWLAINFIYSFFPSGNFWFNYSHLQPLSYPLNFFIGGQGLTFLIMLFNSLAGFLIVKKDKRTIKFLICILIVILSCFIFCNFKNPQGQKVRVALIQGNITNDWNWRIENAPGAIMDIYERLSYEAAKDNPDLIIWPEYAIPADIIKDKILFDRIVKIAKETNANLIVGAVEKTENTDPEFNYIKNTAYVFSRNGGLLGSYASVLPFMFNGVIIPGNELTIFKTDIGSFGITMCAEEEYEFFARYYAKSGVNFLMNLSNDAAIGNLNIMKLKAKHSQFSASETNKFLLRATNNGFTQVINPYGKVIASLKNGKEGILITDILLK